MRYHRPLLMCIAVSFLVGLVGCAEAPTASPPMQADPGMSADPGHAVVPAEGAKEEPPVGEIQERAVPRMAPGVTPSQPIVPAAPAPTPGLSALPGEFALETFVGSGIVSDTLVQTPFGSTGVTMTGPGTPHYLTAVSGGGVCCGALHTDARKVASWERFKLLRYGNGQYVIGTSRGYYLAAGNGGGMGPNGNDWALFTTETTISNNDYAKFRLLQQQDSGTYAIQTPNGINYITAVGGGGRTTDVVHTDATQVRDWEKWRLVKAGDLGSGYCYGIQAFTGFFL